MLGTDREPKLCLELNYKMFLPMVSLLIWKYVSGPAQASFMRKKWFDLVLP